MGSTYLWINDDNLRLCQPIRQFENQGNIPKESDSLNQTEGKKVLCTPPEENAHPSLESLKD